MASELNKIKSPIRTDLEEFEAHFSQSLKSKVPLLDRITYYIVQRKGKQIRPILVFLSAKLVAPITQSTHIAASLIEILHTATLVHDDVVDDSNMRRGFFSINALWKNKIAVLVGDYLFMRGFLLAMKSKEYKLLELVSEAVEKMSVGELLQLEKARKLDITEEVYFDIIRQKTASLMAASCALGAASTTSDEDIIDRMRLFGELAGLSYQIKDDLFDYGQDKIGKPRGIDIKEKKMTLPLIYALGKCTNAEKRRILSLIKNKSEKKATVKEVVDFVAKHGGLKYAEQKMKELREEALQVLDSFPSSDTKESLKELIDYMLSRKK